MTALTELRCTCGQVHIGIEKEPIISAECYCNSCRSAGARLQTLKGAPKILGPHGGTRFVLYRKDRVRFVKGADMLREFRLTPESKTRRIVTSCCHAPVFLEFQSGHWLSLYGTLWPKDALPTLQMRTMTSDLDDASRLPNDVPNARQQNFMFFRRLLGAWIAMGFRVPQVQVGGALKSEP